MEENLIKNTLRGSVKSFGISIICFFTYVFLYTVVFDGFPYFEDNSYVTFVLLFLGFYIITFIIGRLFEQLLLSFKWRFISVFTYYFLLSGGLWMTTHMIFATTFNTERVMFSTVTISFITAIFISWFFPTKKTPIGYSQQIKEYFQRRNIVDWLFRMVLGVIFLFISYFLLNELIFPFLEPYYTERFSSNFIVQGAESQFVNKGWMWMHSLLIIIVFLPLFALWRGSKSSLLFWVGFPLFVICALGPFILNFNWPVGFRFTLLVEMTAIMYMQSFIIVHLFYVPQLSESSNLNQENTLESIY